MARMVGPPGWLPRQHRGAASPRDSPGSLAGAYSHSSSAKPAVALRRWKASTRSHSPMGGGHGVHRLGHVGAGRDLLAQRGGEVLQVAPLRLQRLGPGHRGGAVAGHHAPGGDRGQGVVDLQPAQEAAVERGQVPGEQQVAREERPRRLVEHGEVVVGVRGGPGPELERPPPEVERRPVLDGHVGQDDLHRVAQRVAEALAVGRDVVLGARGQRAGEGAVAHEGRVGAVGPRAAERREPEHVVGVHVGGDHVGHGERRARAQIGQERLSGRDRPARVDDGHGLLAHDEAAVGDDPEVVRRPSPRGRPRARTRRGRPPRPAGPRRPARPPRPRAARP